MKGAGLFWVQLLLMTALSLTVHSEAIIVDQAGRGRYTTIQAAFDAAEEEEPKTGAGVHCLLANRDRVLPVNSILRPAAQEAICGRLSHCLTNRDPKFVRNGSFDFDRFQAFSISGVLYEVPDLIAEEPEFYLRSGSPALDRGTADTNDDGEIDSSDTACALAFLFEEAVSPPAPFPLCRPDPTADALTCFSYDSCK